MTTNFINPSRILFAYILLKIGFFGALLSFNKYVVPDEGTYAQTICIFNQNLVSPTHFGRYLSWGPLFLLQSQFFNLLGVSCLSSVRLANLIFSIGSGYIFFLLLKQFPVPMKKNWLNLNSSSLIFAFYLFIPSKFLWTSIGIREASVEFLVLIVVLSIVKVFYAKTLTEMITFLSLFFISLTILNLTRWMLFICLAVSIIIIALFNFSVKKHRIVFAVTVIVILSNQILPTLLMKSNAIYFRSQVSERIQTYKNEIKLEQRTKIVNKQTVTSSEKLKELENEISYLTRKLEAEMLFSTSLSIRPYSIPDPDDSRVLRTLDARSQIATKNCEPSFTHFFNQMTCNLQHLPTGLYSVLLRPNPIQDWYSTPTKLASLENLIYLIFLLWLVFVSINCFRRTRMIDFIYLPLSFLSISILGLALYEGNVGTSFRHRSVTVWAIALALYQLISRYDFISTKK